MKSKSKSPIWPYLAVLACLFALSITAPRAWDRISRQENLSQMISAHRVHPAPARNRKYFRYPRLDAPTDETLTASLEPAAAAREADASNERAVDDSLPMVAVAEEIVSSFNEPAVPAAPTILEETTRTIESPPEIAGQLSPLGLAQSEEPISVAEPVEETASQPAGAAASRWPVPRALIAQLHQLGQADSGAGWAEQAIKLVERLCGPAGDSAPTALAIVAELRGAIEGGTTLAVSNAALASQRMRAQYALSRWIDIWEPTISHGESAGDDPDASPSASEMAGCLQEVTKLLAKGAAGAAWRKYLHLDELAELAVAESTDLEDQRRRAARQVLDQFKSSQLTAAQRKFATAEPLVELQRQLRSWAAEPISADRLLSDLERYEQSGLASDARLVADDVLGLSFAND
ncbi:MAG TPA: hypothetical protein VHV08_11105, partial [Pirellulales bacterium]|nr:hypothetical protein [Pirellulales bacterium]